MVIVDEAGVSWNSFLGRLSLPQRRLNRVNAGRGQKRGLQHSGVLHVNRISPDLTSPNSSIPTLTSNIYAMPCMPKYHFQSIQHEVAVNHKLAGVERIYSWHGCNSGVTTMICMTCRMVYPGWPGPASEQWIGGWTSSRTKTIEGPNVKLWWLEENAAWTRKV